MASSLESNRSRTCCSVSGELVHPMSGSTALGEVCSKSSTHDLVLAVPACIAVLAGLYMRAVMIGGALWRISLLSPAGIQEPAQRSRRRNDLPLPPGGPRRGRAIAREMASTSPRLRGEVGICALFAQI